MYKKGIKYIVLVKHWGDFLKCVCYLCVVTCLLLSNHEWFCFVIVTTAYGIYNVVVIPKFLSESYVGGSISFRPDIQRPRQMQNALRDI